MVQDQSGPVLDDGQLRPFLSIIAEGSNKRTLKRYGIKMVSGLIADGGVTTDSTEVAFAGVIAGTRR